MNFQNLQKLSSFTPEGQLYSLNELKSKIKMPIKGIVPLDNNRQSYSIRRAREIKVNKN